MPDSAVGHAPVCVNKTDLAALLRTSLPTLDKMLRQHGDRFPVLRRGTNGLEYQFDPAAVVAYLAELDQARLAAGRAKDELMQQYTLPGVTSPEEDGLKPRDLLQLAKLRQIERQEQIETGFLVETSAVRHVLTTAFTALRRDMGTAIRQSCRDANIPEAVTRAIEARIAEAQRSFVTKTQELLSKQPDPNSNGAEPAFL